MVIPNSVIPAVVPPFPILGFSHGIMLAICEVVHVAQSGEVKLRAAIDVVIGHRSGFGHDTGSKVPSSS